MVVEKEEVGEEVRTVVEGEGGGSEGGEDEGEEEEGDDGVQASEDEGSDAQQLQLPRCLLIGRFSASDCAPSSPFFFRG